MTIKTTLRGRLTALMLALASLTAMADDAGGIAVLAGGCFWCIEHDLEKLPGVKSVVSGYAGGSAETANYRSVSAGGTEHLEVVEVRFDPAELSYRALLDHFWRKVDPTDGGGQFCDRGPHYRSAIFALNDEQEKIARESKAALEASGWLPAPVATDILPAARFYAAEKEHQNYATRNPLRYGYYRRGCGRDARVNEVWAKAPPLAK